MLGIFLHDVTSYPLACTNAAFLFKHFKILATWKVSQVTFGNSRISTIFFFVEVLDGPVEGRIQELHHVLEFRNSADMNFINSSKETGPYY